MNEYNYLVMGIYKIIRVQQIIEELTDFKTFIFEDGHNFQYKSGQYLTLIHQFNDVEIRRSYSITSSPFLNEPLAIGIKRIDNGTVSRLLVDNTNTGSELLTIGTGGFFVLPDDVENFEQIFFYAAGSGITPIYSLIKTVLFQYPHLHVVLIYSNRSVNKTAFLQPLENLRSLFPERFQLELIFSNSPDLIRAHLYRDLLLELLNYYLKCTYQKTLHYTCGPDSYMRMCIYTLQEAGIPADNIRKENFIVPASRSKKAEPPDKSQHRVLIRIGDRDYTIVVSYPDTILQAARKMGIEMPYSCEAGRCGSCVALCKKGIVWHSYNEVLTDKELNKGLVLTCVGHPVGGDVDIQIQGNDI